MKFRSVNARSIWKQGPTIAKRAGAAIVDTVYPKTCAGCGSRGHWLCTWCDSTVPALRDGICVRCGIPAMPGFACQCQTMHVRCHRARSVYPYAGWVANAVRRFKYDDEEDRVRHLGPLMAPLLADFGAVSALVPVPLHPTRLVERGFNQSELLAREISKATGVPVKPMLVRPVMTSQQAKLSRVERLENVRNAFALSPEWAPLPGDRLVIVDDVMTTGATLHACVDVLAGAGAAAVSALTLAREMQGREMQAFFAREGVPYAR